MDNNKKIVLAVGAHPDDFVRGCGGSLLKHLERGDKVYGLHMTCCEKNKDEKRRSEALKEANILGLTDVFFAELPDAGLLETLNHAAPLRKCINELGVNRLYGPVEEDSNSDHRNCSKLVKASLDSIAEVLLYQGPRNKFFIPDYYVEITKEQLDRKTEAYLAHYSQREKGSLFVNMVEGIAITHGCAMSHGAPYEGRRFAEAFVVQQIKRKGSEL